MGYVRAPALSVLGQQMNIASSFPKWLDKGLLLAQEMERLFHRASYSVSYK
jgi:hypothetical protein